MEEHIPQDRIRAHLDIDGNDTPSNKLVPLVGSICVVHLRVDMSEIVVCLLQPAPRCEV